MRLRSTGPGVLALMLVCGCGTVSASVKDLRQDAATICRRSNHSFRGLAPPASQNQDASFLSGGETHLAAELKKLRTLSPPAGVADVYRAALSALAQELAVLHGTVSAIHQGEDPASAYKALQQQFAPLENQANNAWQALRIADCLQ
jgi:hypothetical protein